MSGLHYRQGQQASPAGSFPRTLLFSLLTVLLSLAIFVAIGVALMRSSPTAGQPSGPGENGQGEGHTPVVVCHWVPAHGGSFIVITVDDDGANGNSALQAHLHHPNDIIKPESLDACVSPTATPPPPTATPPEVTPTTTTPETTPTSEIEPTVIGPSATPEPTVADPTATPEPTVVDPTATPGATVEGPPQAGGGFPLPGGSGSLLIGIITLASLGMSLTGLGYWRWRLGQQS